MVNNGTNHEGVDTRKGSIHEYCGPKVLCTKVKGYMFKFWKNGKMELRIHKLGECM